MFNRFSRKKIGLSGDQVKSQLFRLTPRLSKKFWSAVPFKLILKLWLVWACLIHYYEHTVVSRAMKKCAWGNWEKWEPAAQPHRVALFADPQIMDAYSYPGRPGVVNGITRVILDHYLARNWRYVQHQLNPDSTFFLGDLFDGGREWGDDYWFKEYKRFNSIFPRVPGKLMKTSVAGNHDIGFGDTVVRESLDRFSAYFGEMNDVVDVGNHTFVILDTISLSDNVDNYISGFPKKFLENFNRHDHPNPKILLSHVPLFRDPEKQTCGKERESHNLFPLTKGEQYQTVISPEISKNVLSVIDPILLFSGDDHDYCHITHEFQLPDSTETKIANEYTVKSCAMNMGISKPAIQLLSLYNPLGSSANYSPDPTYSTEMCYLPDPYKPLKMYGVCTVLTFLILLKHCFYTKRYHGGKRSIFSRLFESKQDTSLPLPISHASEDKLMKASAMDNIEKPNLKEFGKILTVMTTSVLFIFSFYYLLV
ncbi:putative lipid phosphatase CDC1 [Nakaseomyces bracarensis]|uniref:putative lipid phosphatase CDC1 n=1 Tax=Nakaseomyces bracarensis TaxID=273131 RepID=UPI00387109C6